MNWTYGVVGVETAAIHTDRACSASPAPISLAQHVAIAQAAAEELNPVAPRTTSASPQSAGSSPVAATQANSVRTYPPTGR
jgi:hypothetical protein